MESKKRMSAVERFFFCMRKSEGMKTTLLMRILRLSLISVVCAVVLTTLAMCYQTNDMLKQDYEKQAKEYSTMYTKSIAQWTSLIKQQIEHAAMDAAYIDPALTVDEKKELLAEAASTTEFKDLAIAYKDGTTFNGTDISERDYFKAALGGETYISSPILRKTDGKMTIMVATKLANEGPNGEAVIYGGMDVTFFTELLSDIDFGESGMGFIVDSTGTIISWPTDRTIVDDEGKIVEAPAGSELEDPINPIEVAKNDDCYAGFGQAVALMIMGEEGTYRFDMPDGESMLMGYAPVEGNENWSVGVMIEKSEPKSVVDKIFYSSLFFAAIILAVEIVTNLTFSTSIALPIRQATEQLEKIKNGDLSANEKTRVRLDETGVLMNGIEVTRQQLNTYIGEIGHVLQGISDGRLDQNIIRDYEGDFIKIKDSLNKILSSLNMTFGTTNNATSNLLAGARQVEMASQALASASTEQASAVVQITASMDGIAKNTAENTANVMRVNEFTQVVKKEADAGNAQMNSMIEAMKDIADSSQNIAKIMKVIDDIAFQTNILALNASVEAARAGVHGRGFAVVAEEVRELAGKSAEASSEIADMIDDTIRKINAGTEIASETGEKLELIVKDIDEIAGVMEHIAQMSEEQAQAIEQINTGIDQISSVVQSNSATSEQCAASSVELSEQADGLMRQVDYFKLR